MNSRTRLLSLLLGATVWSGCGSGVDEGVRPGGAGDVTAALTAPTPAPTPEWTTVVNNATIIPGSQKKFSSYNQPSVNKDGFVVFRARSTGSDGGGEGGGEGEVTALAPTAETGPVRGIFTRDMSIPDSLVVLVTKTGALAPQPNNTASPFNEFPSIPRIDIGSRAIATRGQSRPVWEYATDAVGTTTRVGTSGVYTTWTGAGVDLSTGASLLGALTDYVTGESFPQFQVPGTSVAPGTRFDQFPGAPAMAGPTTIAFKGNWTDQASVGHTGIYYRDASSPTNRTFRIADNLDTTIPGTATLFGSTAPPSATGGKVVFTGLDVEEAPTMGGIYLAPLSPDPVLKPLVEIGGPVPGYDGKPIAGAFFTRFGEGLSFDGRYVAFWGAWGNDWDTLSLPCPADGNKDVLQACFDLSDTGPDGLPTGNTTVKVPRYQGIFVYDTQAAASAVKVWAVARADRSGATANARFKDFVFWNFSGRPPGAGQGDESGYEPPRWRSNAFAAVNSFDSKSRVAFKAIRADGSMGIYLVNKASWNSFQTLIDTTWTATRVDPTAPTDSTGAPVLVTSVGIERDAFRGDGVASKTHYGYLTINASMANEGATVTWAGIYVRKFANQ